MECLEPLHGYTKGAVQLSSIAGRGTAAYTGSSATALLGTCSVGPKVVRRLLVEILHDLVPEGHVPVYLGPKVSKQEAL